MGCGLNTKLFMGQIVKGAKEWKDEGVGSTVPWNWTLDCSNIFDTPAFDSFWGITKTQLLIIVDQK